VCGIINRMTDLAPLHDALIDWFKHNKEDLPWRQTDDPYRIWLSEIMLQQTQIATVLPYYARFLERFPTVEALAAAPLDDVLKLWEGLGYYSRARNLHRAARMVVEEFGGEFPRTLEGLRTLPGVGPYTAGAVGSIAFGLDVPVLDGNVIRVLARLFNIEDDVRQAGTKRRLWKLAGEIVPAGRAAAWNEGLMELGQRVCVPRSPRCDVCPVRDFCEARALGVQEQRPIRSQKARTPHYDVTAGVIRDGDGHILIAQRKLDAMLGGLWEFPGGKCDAGRRSASVCAGRSARSLASTSRSARRSRLSSTGTRTFASRCTCSSACTQVASRRRLMSPTGPGSRSTSWIATPSPPPTGRSSTC